MWREGQLGEVLKLQRGHDLPERERVTGDIPVVSSSGITGWHNQAKARGPGVVTGRYGTIGEVFFLREDYWPLNTALYVVDFKGNDERFCAYLLRLLLANYQSDKAAVPGVDRNVLHKLPVRWPEPSFQRRIAAQLGSFDDLIENNRRRMALLEDAARQLYREWFVRLRFPGHEHASTVDGLPTGWRRGQLGEFATFLSGGTPSSSRSEYWDGAIPWASSGELTSMRVRRTTRTLTEEAVEAGSRLVPAETILAVVRGMSLAKEFRISLTAVSMSFNQDLKAIRPRADVETLFLFYALDAQRDDIRDKAGEASHGTKKIETAVLAEVPLVLPDRRLQALFCDAVQPMHQQWDALDQQVVMLKTARDLLLPRLMRGEITV